MKVKSRVLLFLMSFIITFNLMFYEPQAKQAKNPLLLSLKASTCLGPLFPYVAGAVIAGAGIYMAYETYKDYKSKKMTEAMENFTAQEVEALNQWAETQDESNIDTSGVPSTVIKKMRDTIKVNELDSIIDQLNNTDLVGQAERNFLKSYPVGDKYEKISDIFSRQDINSLSINSQFIKTQKLKVHTSSRSSFYPSSDGLDSFLYRFTLSITRNGVNITDSFLAWYYPVNLKYEPQFVFESDGYTMCSVSELSFKYRSLESPYIGVLHPGISVLKSKDTDIGRSICIPHTLTAENDLDSKIREKDNVGEIGNSISSDKTRNYTVDLDRVKENEKIGDNPIDRPTDDPIDHPTDKPTNPVLSWEWLKDLLREILDAIKSIPSLLRDVLAGIRAIPSILKDMLDWIKGIPARWSAFWSIDWNAVFAHAQYTDILKVKFKPFYDTIGILSSIKANPQSHNGKFYMKIPKEMGGNGQEQCVLDLSFGDSYFKIARNITKAGMWVAFLFWIIKIFKPKFTIGG